MYHGYLVIKTQYFQSSLSIQPVTASAALDHCCVAFNFNTKFRLLPLILLVVLRCFPGTSRFAGKYVTKIRLRHLAWFCAVKSNMVIYIGTIFHLQRNSILFLLFHFVSYAIYEQRKKAKCDQGHAPLLFRHSLTKLKNIYTKYARAHEVSI